jgi:two-component system, OmpR family, sensor histidine kinase MtrB
VLGALVLLACAALAVLTSLSRKNALNVVRLNEELRAVDGVRIALSKFGRDNVLAYATRDSGYELARIRDESDVFTRLAEARSVVREPSRRALLDKADTQIRDYVALRTLVESQHASEHDALLRAGPAIQAALDTLYEASHTGFDAVSVAERRLARAEVFENTLGIAIAALLLGGFVIVALTLRRFVVAPLIALGNGIDRFAAGDRAARVAPTGTAALQHTVDSFNEMAARLERQHEDLLTFLAGVAHDLRNPLAAMRMGLQLVGTSVPDETKRKTIELLDRQVTRLERMVGDFLDATRIEAGHLELQARRQDLRELAQEAVELYRPSTREHRIVYSSPDASVEVRCDGERIAQVLNNLVSNAIKYSPGGGDVRVSVGVSDDEAVVTVEDSGIGIPPEDVNHIFAPFHRTGVSRETAPGVGLGLSVARQIVEAHGGRIEVESALGAGSTFRVRLPLVGPAPAPAHAPAPASPMS